jgi:hypothetical protein
MPALKALRSFKQELPLTGQRLEPNDGIQLFKALLIKADGAEKIKDDKLRIYSRLGRLSIHGPQERWCRIKQGYFRCPVPVF